MRFFNVVCGVFLLIGLNACTKFDEEINFSFDDYKTLTPSNIDTDLKIVNIVVNQDEYDNMYENYTEEIEIIAKFNLYRNKEVLVENKLIELEIKGTHAARYSLKTLGVKFEDVYDNSNHDLIDPDILPFHSVEKIKAIRLRNSGNDFDVTMVKDISYSKLALSAELNVDLM